MTTSIILSQREKDHLEKAAEILKTYSKIIIVSGRAETEADKAGSACALIESILKEQTTA